MPANHRIADKARDDWPTPITFEGLDGLEREGLRNKGADDQNRYGENQHGRRILRETSCGASNVKRTLSPELQEEASCDREKS
jgi:hypothetical protein